MERRDFDQLTAALGTGASRRRVLGGLGLAVGLMLGRDVPTLAGKHHKRAGKKRKQARHKKAQDTDAAALGIEAKPECDPNNGGDAFCQANVQGTCLTGACTKPVRESRYRCVYTRNNSLCTDPAAPICCNYRLGSPTSGICVAKAELCQA